MAFRGKEQQHCCLLFAFQNVKLTVIPASPETSAQSVKVGFTYTVESALKSALMGWKPTITRWSALASVSLVPRVLPGFLTGDGGSKVGMNCKISCTTREVQLKMEMFCITRCIPQHNKLKVFPKSAISQEAQAWLCPTNTALMLRAILPQEIQPVWSALR